MLHMPSHCFFSLPLTNDLRALTACQIRVMRGSKWIFKFVLVHSSGNKDHSNSWVTVKVSTRTAAEQRQSALGSAQRLTGQAGGQNEP